jgi:hypothetical protein
MAEEYPLGVSKLWYQSKGFIEHLEVTADFRSPSLSKETGLVFTEDGDGLYYLDFHFQEVGVYNALIYENGVKTVSQNFRCFKPYRGISGNTLC